MPLLPWESGLPLWRYRSFTLPRTREGHFTHRCSNHLLPQKCEDRELRMGETTGTDASVEPTLLSRRDELANGGTNPSVCLADLIATACQKCRRGIWIGVSESSFASFTFQSSGLVWRPQLFSRRPEADSRFFFFQLGRVQFNSQDHFSKFDPILEFRRVGLC